MTPAFSSSFGTILVAPWQQRRNRNGLWGVTLIVALCALPPVGLVVFSFFADPLLAPELRRSAAIAGRIAALALAAAWWAVLVGNVLEQNHPTLARVVPGHPRRLRAALLVALGALVAVLVGIVLGGPIDPLVGIAVLTPVLALVAVSMRWPWIWIAGSVLPYVVAASLPNAWVTRLLGLVVTAWRAQPAAIAAIVAMASGLLVASLIQTGGPRHAATYESRRNRMLRMQAAARGERVRGPGARGVLDGILSQPYHWWMRHLLARSGSSPRARALLGLGPGSHWTGNVTWFVATAAAVAALVVVALVVAPFVPEFRAVLPLSLPGTALGVAVALVGPAIQVQSRLHQTQREQALLTLLPGVPRGAAASRWLSGQMTVQFLVSWAGAVGLMAAFGALAACFPTDRLAPMLASGRVFLVIATLPLVAFQWRTWARLAEPTSLSALAPTLTGMGLAALAVAGNAAGWCTPLASGAVFAAVALAWCLYKGWRMGAEPTALPVGRLR